MEHRIADRVFDIAERRRPLRSEFPPTSGAVAARMPRATCPPTTQQKSKTRIPRQRQAPSSSYHSRVAQLRIWPERCEESACRISALCSPVPAAAADRRARSAVKKIGSAGKRSCVPASGCQLRQRRPRCGRVGSSSSQSFRWGTSRTLTLNGNITIATSCWSALSCCSRTRACAHRKLCYTMSNSSARASCRSEHPSWTHFRYPGAPYLF